MRFLEQLEPKDVFYYFEEVCRIPHGSGNIRQISDYLAAFARKQNLEHYQDETGNVIIIKEASAGYEDHAPVILQGHMDMVAVKLPECPIDMTREGLVLRVEGDRLMAEGTSLGGDDGIAIAYGLALMSGDYRHPRIELVLTVDEETGMDGARTIDVSLLKGRRMINLDSEEEGILLAGCAGGARVKIMLSGKTREECGILCKLKIGGLKGGHSGAEIHKGRGNAICLMGRILERLQEKLEFSLVALDGGVADNAIPDSAEADILITGHESSQATITAVCLKLQEELRAELGRKDPNVRLEVQMGQKQQAEVVSREQTAKIADMLTALPNGVQAMSTLVEGLVETSLNPGILHMEQGTVQVEISVRSSLESAKQALIQKLKSLASLAGAQMEVSGEYPGWAYREHSPLRDLMTDVYRELHHRKPRVEAIHAGVECGLFVHKMPELDCISIGPDMKKIHTAEEELSISSTARVWIYLLTLLAKM